LFSLLECMALNYRGVNDLKRVFANFKSRMKLLREKID